MKPAAIVKTAAPIRQRKDTTAMAAKRRQARSRDSAFSRSAGFSPLKGSLLLVSGRASPGSRAKKLVGVSGGVISRRAYAANTTTLWKKCCKVSFSSSGIAKSLLFPSVIFVWKC